MLYLVLKAFVPTYAAGFVGDQSALSVAANITLMHGFLPGAFTGVVPGGWSIGTEWAFYLTFPLLFAGCWKLHSLFGWKILLAPAVIVALVSAMILVHLGMANGLFWFWYDFVFNQFPIFMIGIILFFLVRDDLFRPVLGRDIPMFLIFTGIGLWILNRHFFVMLPLVSAISFVFLFNILRATSGSLGLVERIGRASYSMYIFHFVFAVFATAAILKAFPVGGAWANPAFGVALAISTAATYLVARVSERVIERRFIEFGRIVTTSHPPSQAASRG
jgi:peptidoglycan/LPS O-acetylase OafA/YrhL